MITLFDLDVELDLILVRDVTGYKEAKSKLDNGKKSLFINLDKYVLDKKIIRFPFYLSKYETGDGSCGYESIEGSSLVDTIDCMCDRIKDLSQSLNNLRTCA